jgi:hypothetical protein
MSSKYNHKPKHEHEQKKEHEHEYEHKHKHEHEHEHECEKEDSSHPNLSQTINFDQLSDWDQMMLIKNSKAKTDRLLNELSSKYAQICKLAFINQQSLSPVPAVDVDEVSTSNSYQSSISAKESSTDGVKATPSSTDSMLNQIEYNRNDTNKHPFTSLTSIDQNMIHSTHPEEVDNYD